MAVYSVGVSKAGVNTANTVMWQLKAASTLRARIREIGISISVAPSTAPLFALARSTATGTSSTTVLGQALDAADAAAVTTFDSAWSSAPTFSTSGPFINQFGMPVTAGSGVIWTFGYGEELVIPVSGGLCIANINASGSTTGTMVCYVKWIE